MASARGEARDGSSASRRQRSVQPKIEAWQGPGTPPAGAKGLTIEGTCPCTATFKPGKSEFKPGITRLTRPWAEACMKNQKKGYAEKEALRVVTGEL